MCLFHRGLCMYVLVHISIFLFSHTPGPILLNEVIIELDVLSNNNRNLENSKCFISSLYMCLKKN